VLARITPIDKLRIVEALQRAGHTVAMTGDGVNDAPALRLADVGVAMGAGGTEVARQAADLILADDRFDTLTEALLEGRSLWENLHSALGLLLGGNLGEMILMAGAAVVGRGAVLGTRQILAVNLVTDVLPAVAIAVQPPRQSDLERVTKERDGSFDRRLVRDILRRGTATAVPALGAVLAASAIGASATTVGFASIIVTQLAQTLQAGYSQNQLSPSVIAAIGGSGGLVAGTLALPPLRRFLGLAPPTPVSVALILASAPAATLLAGTLSPRHGRSRARLIEAGPGPRALFGPRSAA
jgi:magnesium-transporting ATPase (P-type)